ncbi:MAG: aminopeptidase P family protein [Solirubrobacterales bacterium]|nr:aminopeptidase P family protein [Solirubrobacterales bacterium]MBV9715441.1 aminopeptidase P family protein [Solirubrobacterales bacterium]
MGWPVDHAKLERFRALMTEQELDAVVVRAPDNIVYLDSYWGMKGYDALVLPARGDAVLIVLEPQLEEAGLSSWTEDLRPFDGYHPRDPRPPWYRSLDICLGVLRERELTGRIGLELSQGTQASDLMVAEPTVFSQPWFDAFTGVCREVVDCSGLLAEARAIKTAQEIERMRLAAELAAEAMEHVRDHLRPGMKTSEVGALYEGYVHSVGVGYRGRVDRARAFTLVWSGPTIRTFTATSDARVCEHEPTLLEIWVCTDGYWCDLTKNASPGELTPAYDELTDGLLGVFGQAIAHLRPGAGLPDLDRLVRAGIEALGYPGQPSHPIAHGIGARAHEPPYAHQAAGGELSEGMVLAVEPGVYWPQGGGLRVEDNFLITEGGCEQLGSYPDDFRAR